jgi:hypothetical protein
MSVRLKKVFKIGALVLAGIILVVAGAITLLILDKPLVKNIIQRYAANKTGIELTIGRLDYKLSPLRIEASALRISYATKVFSLNIASDRVEALGDLRKLIAGEKPPFESVELDIAEVRLDQKEISPEPVNFEGLIQQTVRVLGYSKRISAKCGRLIALLPSQDIRLDSLALAITSGESGGRYGVKLDCENFAGAANQGRLSVGGGFQADGKLRLGQTVGFDLNLTATGPHLVSSGRTAGVKKVSAEVGGDWQPGSGRIAGSNLTISVPGLGLLDGSFVANTRLTASGPNSSGSRDKHVRAPRPGPASPVVTAEAKVEVESLESILSLLKPFLPESFPGVRLEGKARLDGKYSLPVGENAKAGMVSATIETQGVRFALQRKSGPFRGELSGTLNVDGPLNQPRGSGDVRLSLGQISGLGAVVLESSAHLRFKGSKDSAEVSILTGKLRGVSLSLSGHRGLEFPEIDLVGTAGASLGKRPGGRIRIEARLPGLSPIRAAGAFGLRPLSLVSADLETRGQPIPAIRGLLSPFLPARLAPWTLDGAVDVTLKVDGPGRAGRPLAFSGGVSLSQGKFNDADFIVAGDKLKSSISAQGMYTPATRNLALTGTLNLAEGESLWKRFYISWDRFPLKAQVAGRYDRPAGSLEDLIVQAAIPPLGEARAAGRLRLATPTACDLRTSVRLSLEPLLAVLSGGGGSAKGGLEVKGRLSGDLDFRQKSGNSWLDGRLTLEDASIIDPAAGVWIQGLRAEIPIDLAAAKTPAEEPKTTRAAFGKVAVTEVRTPVFTLHPLPLVISCRRNAYEIAPFSIDLFGSRLEFGEISLALQPAPLGFDGTASIRLADLDISRLPFLKPGASPPGKFRVDFPSIDLTPQAVRATGRAELEIFGGRIVIRDLSVADPFATEREVACDIDLLDLDLKKITDLVPFGEVTGIIRGEVRDLVIAYGQPERFELSLESVKRKGVPQTFSLKAVNSLTVITAGQPATQGSGPFWLRFIRGFRYEKIGIAGALKNDTFTIAGTIHENGVEYLVKRPALFGIDVIDRDPGKAVSFKDMMGRLRRIGQSGPPVTK